MVVSGSKTSVVCGCLLVSSVMCIKQIRGVITAIIKFYFILYCFYVTAAVCLCCSMGLAA